MLYQYKICPFCCKVKAVMDYLRVPYETVEVNPLTKKEIKFSKDYQKVPLIQIDGETIGDSSKIIDLILQKLVENGSAKQKDMELFASDDARRWADWVDKQLAILLYPNITRSYSESKQAFSYIDDVHTFTAVEKIANKAIGPLAMWLAQGKIKKKYNIEDERLALKSAIEEWKAAIKGKNFNGGTNPNIADLCVYGCLQAIEGLDAFTEIMNGEQELVDWYERTKECLE